MLASQKGGAGKTTLTGHLAIAAEQRGIEQVVMIDTDPQGSLSTWWNRREAKTPLLSPCPICATWPPDWTNSGEVGCPWPS